MLDLPRGARVTPLDNATFDFDRLTEAFITALRVVAPELTTNVVVDEDRDSLVRVMVQENRNAKRMTGRGLFEV